MVLQEWYSAGTKWAMQASVNPHVRHGMAIVFKTTITRHCLGCMIDMAERCGAQGSFHQNAMARWEVSFSMSSFLEYLMNNFLRMEIGQLQEFHRG